ncbi:MAG: M28 family peptidase [Planctomycetota bacterium]
MKKRKNYKPLIALVTFVILSATGVVYTVGMTPANPLGAKNADEDMAYLLERQTRRVKELVTFQCEEIGRRSSRFSAQQRRFDEWLEFSLAAQGLKVTVEPYAANNSRGKNFIGVKHGRGEGVILVGTHYDSYGKSPCANAVATGVATVIETAHLLQTVGTEKTIIFALFGTGERPHRGSDTAGAHVWVNKYLEEGGKLDMALIVGSFGMWNDAEGSHAASFPWKYSVPKTADWAGVYGGLSGRGVVVDVLNTWALVTDLPARGFAAPSWFPGIAGEDQVPFQKAGIPAVLISDSGTERTPSLRTEYDNPYELDFVEMTRRVQAFADLVKAYSGADD